MAKRAAAAGPSILPAFPARPATVLESAIVRLLPADGASYTAIVRGANNTTGIAVVEVYALN